MPNGSSRRWRVRPKRGWARRPVSGRRDSCHRPRSAATYLTAALFHSSDPDARPLVAAGFYVTPGFLEALDVRMIAGETSWRADSGTAVITRSTLARMYPGLPPPPAIGRLVPTRANGQRPVRIAGVVEDVHLSDITREAPPIVFRPLAERLPGMPVMGLVATAGAPARQAPVVQRVLGAVAPELPLFDIRTARAAATRVPPTEVLRDD